MKLGFDVSGSAYPRLVLQWSRCVLKSPWLCRLGDASYVMCTALYMMVLYDRARVGPTTKTSDEISIICLFRLILQANTLFYFVLWHSSCFEFYVHSISFSSGFSTYGSVMIYYGIHSFIFVRMFIVKTICCISVH